MVVIKVADLRRGLARRKIESTIIQLRHDLAVGQARLIDGGGGGQHEVRHAPEFGGGFDHPHVAGIEGDDVEAQAVLLAPGLRFKHFGECRDRGFRRGPALFGVFVEKINAAAMTPEYQKPLSCVDVVEAGGRVVEELLEDPGIGDLLGRQPIIRFLEIGDKRGPIGFERVGAVLGVFQDIEQDVLERLLLRDLA